MCIFGGGGGSSSSSDGPVSKGPSDQSAPAREENYRSAQRKRDPLGRGDGVSGLGRKGRKRSGGGHGTLLTAGAADQTGKKTLLGA